MTIEIFKIAVKGRIEHELLLHCSRISPSANSIKKIKTIITNNKLDWSYLINKARENGLMLLLYWNLNNFCSKAAPEKYLNILQRFYQANHQRNILLANELIKITQLFEKNNIFCIPFKGPTLAMSAYNNLALRQCGDLDILVGKEVALQAIDCLVANEYKPGKDFTSREQLLEEIYNYYECTLIRSDSSVIIDLHWRCSDKNFLFSPNSAYFEKHHTQVLLNDHYIPTFKAEDLLLYLSVHASKHTWNNVQCIIDIAELINAHPELSNDNLIQRAKKLGNQRMLALALYLSSTLLDSPVPISFIKKLANFKIIEKLSMSVAESLFTENLALASAYEKIYYDQQIQGSYTDRIKHSISVAKQTHLKERWRFPLIACLSILYYLALPSWLVIKNVQKKLLRSPAKIKRRGE